MKTLAANNQNIFDAFEFLSNEELNNVKGGIQATRDTDVYMTSFDED